MQELKDLLLDKKEAQKFIDKASDLEKLSKNSLFKKLFLEEYCEENALRLLDALANVDEETKPRVVAELEAISRFKSHITFITRMGESAKSKLIEIEEAISELENDTSVEA